MRNTVAPILFSLLALAPLRAATATPSPELTQEQQARRVWERFNTASIIANVDGEPITAMDVRNELRPRFAQIRNESKTAQEFNGRINAATTEVTDMLADRQLILADFRDKQMQMPASFVNEQIEEKIIRDFNGDRSEYLASLRREGRTPLDDREQIRESIIVDYLTGQTRKTVAELSPVKIQAFYEANKDGFKQAASVKLSQILLYAGAAETDDDVRKLSADIIARLDKGESFAELAKKFSKDDTRDKGGEAGWRELKDLNADLSKKIGALPNGGHTGAIEFKSGGRLSVYIFHRDDYRAEGARPIAEVREIIEGKLLAESQKTVREEWLRRLHEHFFVRYY